MSRLVSPTFMMPDVVPEGTSQTLDRYEPQVQALVSQLQTRTSGESTDITWSAGLFSGENGQTWTVTKANAEGFYIQRIGNLLIIGLWLNSTTVAGTADPTLTMILPNRLTAAQSVVATVAAIDNGYRVPGATAFIDRGDNRISIQKFDLSNWVPSSANTYIGGQILVEVE
jgi:hypothetical protein